MTQENIAAHLMHKTDLTEEQCIEAAKAIEELHKKEMIEFLEWTNDMNFKKAYPTEGEPFWRRLGASLYKGINFTTEELYNLFIEQKEKK